VTGPDAKLLERANTAASRSEWRTAYELLRQADAAGLLGAADLPRLADAAYAAGHLDVTIEVWERAHAAYVRTGEPVAAAGAAARVAMHLLFDTALMAPVRGWLLRSERLLDGLEETPVHAWIAVLRSYERLLVGDLEGARAWAARATDIGSRCDPAAAAIGRVAEARTLILAGEVRRGVALLDEAGVAAVSGELDSLSTGVVYCELVCALQGLAQFDLAQQWTEAMERWRPAGAVGSVHGRCRVHRAEILRLRGACDEAEAEALLACDELRPYLRRELGWPLNELGRIRLMRGDIDGAEEAYLEAHEAGWDPQPGLALVRLARGDSTLAAASIRDALERPSSAPSKELPPNTELRRAPLLEAQVEIEIAAGDLARARSAANELQQVADKFESKALGACAALARGRLRLAEGDAADAQPSFETAARLWHDVGAPYETALARIGLGEALRAQGNERGAALELRAAHAMLERIGAVHRRESVGRTDRTRRDQVDEHRSETSSADHQTFRRDGDYWSLAFDGKKVLFKDYKGMHYLARLLGEPGRELHVLDLVALESGGAAPGSGPEPERLQPGRDDAGEMLDARAKAAYRRRLAEIEEDLAQAQAMGDAGRTAQAHAERDFLARELSRAVGLGGRDRSAGSASERARASVTRAIRQAMTRIRQQHPSLGRHLDRTIRTGTYCSYLAEPREASGWSF
jgi:tetratricopeptide (TPR) repeat protein